MGRLAGPTTTDRKRAEWKSVVEHRRANKRSLPPAPLAALPAARRRQALLWFIEDGLTIGAKNHPPLTPGLGNLIRLGLARLTREPWADSWTPGRRNVLRLTEKGRTAVESSPPDAEAISWILRAKANGMLP